MKPYHTPCKLASFLKDGSIRIHVQNKHVVLPVPLTTLNVVRLLTPPPAMLVFSFPLPLSVNVPAWKERAVITTTTPVTTYLLLRAPPPLLLLLGPHDKETRRVFPGASAPRR